MRCEREKRAEIRTMTSFERFVSERDNLVLNSVIYCKPVMRFENRSGMMGFRSSSNGPGSRIENKLERINLSSCKIKQKRNAIVDFRVNEISSDSWSSGRIKHILFFLLLSISCCLLAKQWLNLLEQNHHV